MAQFLVETFTGTTGVNLETYNPNWIRASGGGAAQISNNRVRHAAGAGTAGYRRGDAVPPSADYSVSADLYVNSTTANISAGPCGRYLSTETTYYHARLLTGTGIQLVRYTLNGSASTMATYPFFPDVGAVFNLRLEMIGALISAYLDGVQVLSVTNTNNAGPGYPGLRFASAGPDLVQMDNLIADDGASDSPGVSAALSWADAQDSAALAVVLNDRADIVATDPADTIAIAAAVINRAALQWTDPADGALLVGAVDAPAPAGIAVTLAWADPPDVSALVALLKNRAAISYSDPADVWALGANTAQLAPLSGSVRFDALARDLRTATIHISN